MEIEVVIGAEAELPQHASWLPETPIKPIPPRPEQICTDMQQHQQGTEECSDSEEFPPGFAPKDLANEVASHGSTNRAQTDTGLNNLEALLSGADNTLWPDTAIPATAAAKRGPFSSLLALADAAVTGRSQKDFTDAMDGSYLLDSFYEWLTSNPENSSSSGAGSGLPQFCWINANHSTHNPYGLPDLPEHACDVNMPPSTQAPSTQAEAVINGAMPHFAPITPDKALGVQSRLVSKTHEFGKKDRMTQQYTGDSDAARRLVQEGDRHIQELLKAVADAPSADVSTWPKEDNKIEKIDDQYMSMSKTSQQKPRRKKHRPKVVSEGKSRTPKPRTPKNAGTEGEMRVKRKYVRRKGIEKPNPTLPTEINEESGRQNRDPSKKSCRRALNFDNVAESEAHDMHSQSEQLNANDQLPQGIEVKVGYMSECMVHELNHKAREDILFQGSQDPSKIAPAQTHNSFQPENLDPHSSTMSMMGRYQLTTHSAPNNLQMQTLTSQTKSSVTDCEQPTELKRCYDPKEVIPSRYMNMYGVHFNSLQAYESISWLHFPNIHKKKRTEKGQVPVSGMSSSTNGKTITSLGIVSKLDAERTNLSSKLDHGTAILHENVTALQGKQQGIGCVLPFSQTERSTKKRSRGLTRVRDSASLSKLTEYCVMSTYHLQQSAIDDNSQSADTPMQVLLMEMNAKLSRKKRTRRLPPVNSAYPWTLAPQLNGSVTTHQNHLRALAHTSGHQSELFWEHYPSVDSIVKQLECLDINRKSSTNAQQDQNALIPYGIGNHDHRNMLVLYKQDGTIVPFDGSNDPHKRRQPRPKVDLDEETNRVWKLLLEDINSPGIDGTEKAQWWEEERRIFKGRTDSFIARMHLVQGDRRFSPWKGSVVDSVVGVFLTQNVSDHLSSSAFMSLAARFPTNLRQNHCFEEGISSVINEPEASMLDLEYTSGWNEKMTSPTVCDCSSMTLNEAENGELEVVNSEECLTSAEGRIRSLDELNCCFLNSNSSRTSMEISHSVVTRSTIDFAESICTGAVHRAETDGISFQESAASSQNSTVTLKAGSCEGKGSSSDKLETRYMINMSRLPETSSGKGPTSFMQLLHMAGSTLPHEVSDHETGDMSSNDNSSNALLESGNTDHGGERPDIDASNAINSTLLEDECCQESSEEGKTSDSYKVDSGRSLSDGVTATNQATTEEKMTTAVDEIPRISIDCNQICSGSAISKNQVDEHPEHYPNVEYLRENDRMDEHTCMPKLSCQNQQNSCSMDHSKSSNQESAERCLSDQVYPTAKESSETDIRASKSKTSAAGKDRNNDFDWEGLRKQAESSGRKRTRSQGTMDSVDWEAVRCANVNEIAETIKDRGMNNVLAGRIQDFLNRLVREHGSVDLEWLRDIPPDKAKEYLLSFRGLGLKSVECVRLLTLHHLAFPVDTNVGRIAVRLGWVPLQPLPESLQLHLLELYPVLESIQKYLWPRLCKLDQRTLYELHYQMITFGKVFCTKSRPNCNACPMRGECRHFASAFASARLALPAPEQKSIVGSSETVISTQNHSEPLQLPSPLAADNKSVPQQLAIHGANNCQPIIEEPASPEPECTQIVENDKDGTDLEDFNEIPTIKLNIEEFTQNLQTYMQQNMELQEGDMSKALVALTPEAASIPVPKLKNVSRLRTEHLVYEIPDGHPLLNGLDKLEPDDPSKYLLAIWTPGETANSIDPPEQKCNSQELGTLCNDGTCFSCHCIREANSQTVRGTILIPCRTAMRGSFPLNGTYFQVNEVFADHESSLHPIDVPRDWLWKLQRRTVYFGTSIPAIFKGLTTEGIQHCFWRGYVCVRGFDRLTRAPRPLMARLHFPVSKLPRKSGKIDGMP